MKLKLVTNKEPSFLDNIHRYITNWKRLCLSPDFKHNFVKFFLLTKVFNKYEVLRLESDNKLLILLYLEKHRAEHYIRIVNFITSRNIIKDLREDHYVDVLQKLRVMINNYHALGYYYLEISFNKVSKTNINFFTRELDFVFATEKNLANLASSINDDTITLTKKLNRYG